MAEFGVGFVFEVLVEGADFFFVEGGGVCAAGVGVGEDGGFYGEGFLEDLVCGEVGGGYEAVVEEADAVVAGWFGC